MQAGRPLQRIQASRMEVSSANKTKEQQVVTGRFAPCHLRVGATAAEQLLDVLWRGTWMGRECRGTGGTPGPGECDRKNRTLFEN